jgi:hypothetical protein
MSPSTYNPDLPDGEGGIVVVSTYDGKWHPAEGGK